MSKSRVAERGAAYALQATVEPAFGASFDLLATAPQGVAKLRELILSLAVRGRLLAQRPNDPSVSDVFHRIDAAKNALVTSRLIKASKPLRKLSSEDAPFELPKSWRWVTLSELCATLTDGDHLPPPKADDGVPFLVIGDVRSGSVNLETASRFVPRSYFAKLDWSRRPMAGDILYTTVGSYGIPVPLLVDQEFCFQRHIALFRPALRELHGFLTLALASPFVFAQATAGATGIAQKTVPLSAMRNFKIPLPPLSEQARIVARVEELMQFCDALEAHGRLQDEQHARLVATLFDALAAGASAEELAGNWQRIATHFDLLLDRPEAVDALEQTLLQLAVRGLLVPQDSNDEPASELLHEIQACKAELSTRAGNGRQVASRDELTFNLPMGWESVGLLDLCAVGGGATPSKGNPSYWDGDIPWVSPKDMKVDLIEDSQDHVSPKALSETRLPLVPKNSLLVVVRGMILVHSFPVAVTTREVTLNQDMKSFTPYLDGLTDFLALVLKGFKPQILSLVARSTHGTCKLESEKLFGFTFGLPPLREQHRIVARVEQLRRLCADLRERLQQARATQSRLADALVARAG